MANVANLDEQTLALVGNFQTENFFNVLHFTGDLTLIHKIMEKISYRKIPYSIDFNKILKPPKDLFEAHGSELPEVYAYLTIASPFTKAEWYPKQYSEIEKYDEETYETVYQTVSAAPGFTPDDIKEFIQHRGNWINLDYGYSYELVMNGKRCVESIMKYGALDDGWCKKNWGAYYGGQIPIPTYTGNCDTLIFKTAGGDIRPLVSILSKKYPNIKIEYLWIDNKFSHECGKYTYSNGKGTGVVTETDGNYLENDPIANEIKNNYFKGYTDFDYNDRKKDYILSGKNVSEIRLFELMREHDALTTYDGHEYNYDKLILPF